jgi:hypothetical protein
LREATNLINIAQHNLLNRVVLEHFSHNTTITSTNNKHLLRVGVTCHRKVADHLLVTTLWSDLSLRLKVSCYARKFVAFSALNYTVQSKDVAIRLGIEDEDVLIE